MEEGKTSPDVKKALLLYHYTDMRTKDICEVCNNITPQSLTKARPKFKIPLRDKNEKKKKEIENFLNLTNEEIKKIVTTSTTQPETNNKQAKQQAKVPAKKETKISSKDKKINSDINNLIDDLFPNSK